MFVPKTVTPSTVATASGPGHGVNTSDPPSLPASAPEPASPELPASVVVPPSRGQSLAAPLVTLTVVVKSPAPSGQRPYVVVACDVQLYESTTVMPVASYSRA